MPQPYEKSQECEACDEDAEKISEQEAAKRLSKLSGWTILEKNGVPQLNKTYPFKDFLTAEIFARKIGKLAEEHGHHPAILLEWGSVTLSWWSHKIQGLHRVDFKLAAVCDQLTA